MRQKSVLYCITLKSTVYNATRDTEMLAIWACTTAGNMCWQPVFHINSKGRGLLQHCALTEWLHHPLHIHHCHRPCTHGTDHWLCHTLPLRTGLGHYTFGAPSNHCMQGQRGPSATLAHHPVMHAARSVPTCTTWTTLCQEQRHNLAHMHELSFTQHSCFTLGSITPSTPGQWQSGMRCQQHFNACCHVHKTSLFCAGRP